MPNPNSTDWSDQVQTMFKVWSTAQKKMWENWYDMAQAAPRTPPFSGDMNEQWRRLAGQGLAAWMAGAGPTAREAAERLFSTQDIFFSFLNFSAKAWQSMAVGAEAGEAWSTLMNRYLDQLRTDLVHIPERLFQAGQGSEELWRQYVDEVNRMAQPWLQAGPQAWNYWAQAVRGDRSGLLELAQLYWDAYERSIGRLTKGPGMGPARELEQKLLHGFEAWQEFNQAAFEYQMVLADVWLRAFERLGQKLVALAQQGQTIRSLQEVAQLWTDVADSVFIDAFYSDKYIRSQGRLVNAAMANRIQQREILELLLQAADLPTRTEVDRAHRNIHQQGKEIKALRKALDELQEALPPADTPSRVELNEARQTIEALRQEVERLKEDLSKLSAQAGPPKATARKSPARSRKNKGGTENAAVSDSNPA